MLWKNLSQLKGIILTVGALFLLYGMSLNAFAASGVTQTDADTNNVTVTWSADSSAYGYNVYLSSDGNTYARTTSDTECDVHKDSGTQKKITNLTAGSSYYVKVNPVYRSSEGAISEGESLGTVNVVTAPSRVKAASIKQTKATYNSISIKWSSVSGATSYIVFLNNKKAATVTATSAKISVDAGSVNNIQIRAVKKSSDGFAAKGGYTEAYDFYAAPGKPAKLASFKNNNFEWYPTISNKVTVGWNKSSDDEYEATGYQVEIYSVNGKKLKTYSTTNTKVKVKLASIKNKGFKVRVRGYIKVNGKKCYGKWTGLKTIIPQATTTLQRTDNETLKVSWKSVSNAEKYIIYVANYSSGGTKKWKKAAVVGKNVKSYSIKNCVVGKNTAVYVIPVVKIGNKTYKASYTWFMYMYMS